MNKVVGDVTRNMGGARGPRFSGDTFARVLRAFGAAMIAFGAAEAGWQASLIACGLIIMAFATEQLIVDRVLERLGGGR